MLRLLSIVISVLMFPLVVAGCKKQEKCATGDRAAVCKEFQECLKSNVSAEVCRMGEHDANQSSKDLAPAYNGTADALKGSSPQKNKPQQPPKQ